MVPIDYGGKLVSNPWRSRDGRVGNPLIAKHFAREGADVDSRVVKNGFQGVGGHLASDSAREDARFRCAQAHSVAG